MREKAWIRGGQEAHICRHNDGSRRKPRIHIVVNPTRQFSEGKAASRGQRPVTVIYSRQILFRPAFYSLSFFAGINNEFTKAAMSYLLTGKFNVCMLKPILKKERRAENTLNLLASICIIRHGCFLIQVPLIL